MKTIKIKISGVGPLIMHNGQLADRKCPYVQEMKKINAKKKNRTEEDFERLERLEWEGGLWLHEGAPCLPADSMHACLIEGARKTRGGKKAEAGVWCDEAAPIKYAGPKCVEHTAAQRAIPLATLDELYADPRFVDSRGVKVQRARIMRTRPIFRDWSATVTLTFDPKQADESDVRGWLKTAGEEVGIGDHRPRFGRFVVE